MDYFQISTQMFKVWTLHFLLRVPGFSCYLRHWLCTCYETVICFWLSVFFSSAYNNCKWRRGMMAICPLVQMVWTRVLWPFIEVIFKNFIIIPYFWSRQGEKELGKIYQEDRGGFLNQVQNMDENWGATQLWGAVSRNPCTCALVSLTWPWGRSMKTLRTGPSPICPEPMYEWHRSHRVTAESSAGLEVSLWGETTSYDPITE